MIYLGESRVVAFREVLQGFRPRPDLLFKLRTKTSGADPEDIAIDIAAGYVVHEGVLRGIVHREWRAVRRIAHIYIHLHPCVDLFDPAAWSYLSYVPEIQELAHDLKIDSIDLSSLTSGNRQLTQGISRHIYGLRDEEGNPRFSGIRFPSRFGSMGHAVCWALYDDRLSRSHAGSPREIVSSDPDLHFVAHEYHLLIEHDDGTYSIPGT